jgi:hypothetical protein
MPYAYFKWTRSAVKSWEGVAEEETLRTSIDEL